MKEVETWQEAMDILKEEIEAQRPLFAIGQVSLQEFLSEQYRSIPLETFPLDIMMAVALASGPAVFPNMNRIYIFDHSFPVQELDGEAHVFVCVPCSPDEEFDPVQFMSLRIRQSTYS